MEEPDTSQVSALLMKLKYLQDEQSRVIQDLHSLVGDASIYDPPGILWIYPKDNEGKNRKKQKRTKRSRSVDESDPPTIPSDNTRNSYIVL